jgi:inositol transport system substrate-binding protein
MKHGLKMAGLVLATSGLVAGCGSTGSTGSSATTSGGASGSGSSTGAGSGKTVDYAAGAAVKPKDGKKLKIGVSFPELDQFLQKVADGVKARAAEDGVEVSVVSAEKKVEVQLGQIENFISQKVDGIIVLAENTDATDQITSKVKAANIPLVYVNRRPSKLDAATPYVGSDSIVAGQLQGQELARLLGNKGNVAILNGDLAQEAAQLRTKGCKEALEKAGLKVTLEQEGKWYRDKGLSITENWLQTGKEINGICANNDEMALGAIQALKNAGKLANVKVAGVDATADALKAMAAGDLPVTVFQDAKGQGAGGVDTIVQMYNKESVPSVVNVPYRLVTPANMAEFQGK